jgi:hypothetical protein
MIMTGSYDRVTRFFGLANQEQAAFGEFSINLVFLKRTNFQFRIYPL